MSVQIQLAIYQLKPIVLIVKFIYFFYISSNYLQNMCFLPCLQLP